MGTQERLTAYLRQVKDRLFVWGEHDCLTLTNGAWRAMHGAGWADDWVGRYMVQTPYGIRPMRQDQLRCEFGFRSFVEAVDARLTPVRHIPPRGALVATKRVQRWAIGYGLGICVGTKCAFLSDRGVIYLPVTDISKAWVT
jgi:hypothetical protein